MFDIFNLTPEQIDFLLKLFWIEVALFMGVLGKGDIGLPYRDKLENKLHLGTLVNLLYGPGIQYIFSQPMFGVTFSEAWVVTVTVSTGLGLVSRATESRKTKQQIHRILEILERFDSVLEELGIPDETRLQVIDRVTRATSLLDKMKKSPFSNGSTLSTAMREGYRSLDKLIELFPKPIFYFNVLGNIISVNEAFVNMAEAPQKDILNICVLQTKNKELRKAIRKTLSGKCAYFEDEYRMMVNPDKYLYLEIAFEPLHENGSVIGGFGIIENWREVKSEEELLSEYSLEDITKALEKKQQIEAIA